MVLVSSVSPSAASSVSSLYGADGCVGLGVPLVAEYLHVQPVFLQEILHRRGTNILPKIQLLDWVEVTGFLLHGMDHWDSGRVSPSPPKFGQYNLLVCFHGFNPQDGVPVVSTDAARRQRRIPMLVVDVVIYDPSDELTECGRRMLGCNVAVQHSGSFWCIPEQPGSGVLEDSCRP